MKNNFNQTVNRNKFIEIQMSFNFFKQHVCKLVHIFLSLREVNVKSNYLENKHFKCTCSGKNNTHPFLL